MSVTPLAVAEVAQRGRRKPTALTLDLVGVRAAIAELQRAERVLLAAQAAADAPADEQPAEPGPADGERPADGPITDDSLAGAAAGCACGHAQAVHWKPSAGAPREGCSECDACPRFRAAAPVDGEPTAAASPDGQDAPGPAARRMAGRPRSAVGRIRQAEMLDGAGGRQVLVWGDPRIDEVLAAGGTLVRTFDAPTSGGAARERTVPGNHPELFLVPAGRDGEATATAS